MNPKMSSVSSSTSGSCSLLFCRISKGEEVIFTYNAGELDHEPSADTLQLKAPSFHSWFSHTEAGRTYGFLVRDGYTFFALQEPCSGNLDAFLDRVRVGFLKTMDKQRNSFTASSSPILCRLIDLDASVNRKIITLPEQAAGLGAAFDRNSTVDEGWRIDIDQESPRGDPCARRNSGASGLVAPAACQTNRKWWLRRAKIIIVAQLFVFLGLFMAWLIFSRGFKYLSR